ncbi:MAG: alpha/beta hydrolase [Pseudorhodoplanes sp.]
MLIETKEQEVVGVPFHASAARPASLVMRALWTTFRVAFQASLRLPEPWLSWLAGRDESLDRLGLSQLDPRARLHARFVRRFTHVSSADPVEARSPRLVSLWLLEGKPERMRSCQDYVVPGPGGALRARLYTPHDCHAATPALIYLHFGGGVTGDLETCHTACTIIAKHANCKVLSVDYRLAPEHRFPAAVFDVVAAFKWLRSKAGTLGIDPDRIGVGGDSAGGNLAAAASLFLREEGGPMPVMQLLLYPVLEMARRELPETPFDHCYPLTREEMAWFADLYVGGPKDASDPLCSVLRASSFVGLPSTVLGLARHDVLFNEGNAYAAHLRADGVPVAERIFDTLPHAFSAMSGGLPAARAALIEIAALTGRALRTETCAASGVLRPNSQGV